MTTRGLAVLAWFFAQSTLACVEREPTPAMSPGPHDYTSAVTTAKLWQPGDAGTPLYVRVRVLDTCGEPLAGARVQLLHANPDGDHEADRWRTTLAADARGEVRLVTIYPGYAGSLPRHIHFVISQPGYQQVVTRLFFKSDPSASSDVEDLAMVLEEIERDGKKGWIAGYEFALKPL